MPDDYVVGSSCFEASFETFERNLKALVYAADSTRHILIESLPRLRNSSRIRVLAEIDRIALNEDRLLYSTALADSNSESEDRD